MTEILTSRWWRDACAGKRPPIRDGEPQPGFYQVKRVKRGPWLPARIWQVEHRNEEGDLEADVELHCEIAGEKADPYQEWPYLAKQPIHKLAFETLSADLKWLGANAGVSERRAVDLREMPNVRPPGR